MELLLLVDFVVSVSRWVFAVVGHDGTLEVSNKS